MLFACVVHVYKPICLYTVCLRSCGEVPWVHSSKILAMLLDIGMRGEKTIISVSSICAINLCLVLRERPCRCGAVALVVGDMILLRWEERPSQVMHWKEVYSSPDVRGARREVC